ncbi:unnamed protein product [Closterium sp. NIES-64]|nr:unnamed protein product [Closterium sp. NIES-64]
MHQLWASAPSLSVCCAYLNSYLAARTFFVSYDLSIADVAIYAGLFATGQRWDSIRRSPTAKYPNLIRWFNTVSAEAPDLAPSLLPFSRKAAQALASAAKKGPGTGEEAGKGGGKGKEEKGDGAELELPGAVYGQVVTRFPPEPSGFMHIGHAKAALMNQFFAEKYGGKMLVRFDDTNPSKEKDEFVESILADMARLGLTWDTITHTSDYFDGLIVSWCGGGGRRGAEGGEGDRGGRAALAGVMDGFVVSEVVRRVTGGTTGAGAARHEARGIAMCEKLIREGKAYVDSTPKEQMREERMVGTESACRGHSIERNLELWAEMLKGSDVGKECCVRAKWDMQHSGERNLQPWTEMLKGRQRCGQIVLRALRAKWDMRVGGGRAGSWMVDKWGMQWCVIQAAHLKVTKTLRDPVYFRVDASGLPHLRTAQGPMNKTLRDPVYFRVDASGLPHLRTGTKYKAYPTYDFACPYVDSIEGVTHALRSSEYHDRNEQYYRVLEVCGGVGRDGEGWERSVAVVRYDCNEQYDRVQEDMGLRRVEVWDFCDMGLRRVEVWDFSRLNFVYTLLSKRKLAWFVDNGRVTGWDDPRFPTVQGMLRRGLTVPALKQFILSQVSIKWVGWA